MTRPLHVLLALAFVLTPLRASADAAAEARFHDEEARRHYSARRYVDAVREFMVEQRLAPNPNIVFNIALCFRRLNRHADAYTYYAEYLATGDDEDRLTQSRAALQELRPRVALVQVESVPAGAAIFVDRRELGQYGETPRMLALGAGEHRIWVEREGYLPAEDTVTVELGGESTVRLAPTQILGTLQLSAATPAEVRLRNASGAVVFEGMTPVDERIPPGTYQVEATAGEERWAELVVVRADAITEATAILIGPTGAATVTSDVPGALVTLDGEERGFTPQVLSRVPVGEHRLRVTAESMRPYEGPLAVNEDSHLWVTVDLSPADAGEVSWVTWLFGGLAVGGLIGASVMTGFAADSYERFLVAQRAMEAHAALAAESDFNNLVADVLWLGTGIALITAVVLLFSTTEFGDQPSRATVSQGEP